MGLPQNAERGRRLDIVLAGERRDVDAKAAFCAVQFQGGGARREPVTAKFVFHFAIAERAPVVGQAQLQCRAAHKGEAVGTRDADRCRGGPERGAVSALFQRHPDCGPEIRVWLNT